MIHSGQPGTLVLLVIGSQLNIKHCFRTNIICQRAELSQHCQLILVLRSTSYLVRFEKLRSAESGVPQQILLLKLLFIGLLRYVVVLTFQLIAVLAITKYYLVDRNDLLIEKEHNIEEISVQQQGNLTLFPSTSSD